MSLFVIIDKSLTYGLLDRNVDDVHNLMDDVAEQQEIANEISDAISNPIGFGQDVDEVILLSSVIRHYNLLIFSYILR